MQRYARKRTRNLRRYKMMILYKKGKLHEVKFLRFETKSSNQIVIELANYV